MSAQEKQGALRIVLEAASLHRSNLVETLSDHGMSATFKSARRAYIDKLGTAINAVEGTRFEDAVTVSERVRELDLAQLVALQLAVADRIRDITPLSEFR